MKNYEDRYRGECLLSVFRGNFSGRIMLVKSDDSYPFFRLIVGERYSDHVTFESAFNDLAVLE